jgi:hypothetical protein
MGVQLVLRFVVRTWPVCLVTRLELEAEANFLAVILIDFPPFEQLANEAKPDRAEAYFIGASRARQLLGVVAALPSQECRGLHD